MSTKKLLGLLLLIVIINSCTSNIEEERPANVVFIFADDLAFDALGALGNGEVQTPNLDRLAKRGTSFTHAFNQGSHSPAVCLASRAMLISGHKLWRAATYTNIPAQNAPLFPENSLKYTLNPNQPETYWPEYMKKAGYETYMTGKWHVKKAAEEIFDHVNHVRPGMPNQTQARYDRKFIEGEEDTWRPYDKAMEGFWKGGKHWSEIVGDDAISYIRDEREAGQPFFIYAAFNAPHDPRQSPKEFVDRYPLENISIPDNFIPEYPYADPAGTGFSLRDEKLAPMPRTEYAVKVNRQEYYAIITHMDEQIGRILDELEAQGLADNTYIIFTADHGLAVGDHGLIGKQNLYDRSVRVPFILAGPDVPQNQKKDMFIYLQDAMATALEVAGYGDTLDIDFKSVLPLASATQTTSNYPIIYGAYLGAQRMIRTKEYKMILYPAVDMVRLYDLKNDPEEMQDLAQQKESVERLNILFEDFKKLQKEMQDPVDLSATFSAFMTKYHTE